MAKKANRLCIRTQQSLALEWNEMLKTDKVPRQLREGLIKALFKLKRYSSPEINISSVSVCARYHGVKISEGIKRAIGKSLTPKTTNKNTNKESERRHGQRSPIRLPFQLSQSY